MKLYIGGISPEVTENELQDLYSQYGKVRKVDLLKDETGTNRGYAFVEMENDQDGESAILGTHNTLMGGANIQVSVSRSRLDQKREKQQKHKKPAPFQKNDKAHIPTGPKRQNNFRRPKSSFSNSQNSFQGNNDSDDRYNRKSAPIQKGLDYGRTSASPQMSFLGQEGFATSLRTVDPLHSANPNSNFKRNEGGFYRKNNNGNNFNRRNNQNNQNFNNRRGPSNFKKRYDNNEKDSEGNDDNQIFKKNTSDIIGNLE